ncbi:Fe-S cluster assembly ATPase SufC [Candidatus Cerribacteria bacterium 'Amazon FNV 2010 28 9']|uniref:Fe-S cluster assembly ATPase SufC n=1 Tax=Candidatus Cerribacteria bacterium 'Amazon FNV 2010 28 9' TaxID=2081795 RepID=A0A317JQ79_9BACT|nr:MAG: Fe-S cluster assembly ATPase SufC [Candidatus Cerribacteria bacterium 'Amazon FNV 2010 28 9']
MHKLVISNLHARIEQKEILKGVNLTIQSGEIHAIMGPNGSGKSTLANTLAGHPSYEVTEGTVHLDRKNILEMSPDERAHSGLFLAFQYPSEVSGVRVHNFLKTAYEQRFGQLGKGSKFASVLEFRKHVEELALQLGVKKELLSRGLNEGFSGGEKKRLEILQMALLVPSYAILDETDSGLDIDAIKTVAEGVKQIITMHNTGIIVITHYQRILKYLEPDVVHIMREGKIVQDGGTELVQVLEEKGYSGM